MSISSGPSVGALCLVLLAAPGLAQTGPPKPDLVGPLLERAQDAYAQPEPERERPADCPEAVGNEIVVCAPIEQDSDRFRVTSRLEQDDESHLAWSGEAPDVSGPGIFKGPATVGGLCLIPPCPKPPVYIFDVTALPEAPPGSDADRIGRGLAPRGSGYDGGEEPPAATADPPVPSPAGPEPEG